MTKEEICFTMIGESDFSSFGDSNVGFLLFDFAEGQFLFAASGVALGMALEAELNFFICFSITRAGIFPGARFWFFGFVFVAEWRGDGLPIR